MARELEARVLRLCLHSYSPLPLQQASGLGGPLIRKAECRVDQYKKISDRFDCPFQLGFSEVISIV